MCTKLIQIISLYHNNPIMEALNARMIFTQYSWIHQGVQHTKASDVCLKKSLIYTYLLKDVLTRYRIIVSSFFSFFFFLFNFFF